MANPLYFYFFEKLFEVALPKYLFTLIFGFENSWNGSMNDEKATNGTIWFDIHDWILLIVGFAGIEKSRTSANI